MKFTKNQNQKKPLHTRRKITAGVSILATVTLLISLLAWANPLEKWQLKLTNRFYDRNAPNDQIVIVGIDEKSASDEGLGRWGNWSRQYYSQTIENLEKAGAKVIGIDLFLSDESEGISKESLEQILKKNPSLEEYAQQTAAYLKTPHPEDAILAKTFERYNNIVIVDRFLTTAANQIQSIPLAAPFREKVITSSSLTIPDADDVARRIPKTVWDETTEKNLESFSISVVSKYGKVPSRVPDELLINYAAVPYSFPMLSFANVYNNLFEPNDVEGKIILIGVVTERIQDHVLTPTSSSTPMPGVEVHANAIQTLLEGKFLKEQSLMGQIAMLAILVALTVLATLFLPIIPALILTAVMLLAYHLLAEPIFDHGLPGQSGGLILNLVYPTLAILLAYLLTTLYRSLTESREKAQLKNAFAKYVSKDLVGKILENPSALKLGGEKRQVTVFFSDIKDSTHYSEILSPEAWVAQLNEYFEVMAGIVMKNNGNLNKFEGDAIMAFWGAPLDEANHAALAARTALECRAALKTLHERWTLDKKPLIDFRVGLSTGEVIAGNMGSRERFDYTVMGDRVNLGSRLESANKEYGTHVMVSEETAKGLGGGPTSCPAGGPVMAEGAGEFILRSLDKLRVKGKDQPVEVFELMGFSSQLTEAGKTMLKSYHKALAAYRACRTPNDFAKAEALFQNALKLAPQDGPTLVYLNRCAEFKINPPWAEGQSAGWDATWTLEHK